MTPTANFLAIDLGASSGRVMLGRWDGGRFDLQELHRFPNGPVQVMGHLHWDVLRLWQEIKAGIAKYASQYNQSLAGIGVDSWGVDFALLDGAGRLLGNPYHYRDRRTEGMPEMVDRVVPPQKLFAVTGIQRLPLNTINQLVSMRLGNDPQLDAAITFLMMPDLFHYWMTGRAVAEYTNASTTQFFNAVERRWDLDILELLNLPSRILPPVVGPGTILGDLLPEVQEEVGLQQSAPVIASASHDTASAVAAIPGLDERSMYISSGTWSLVGVEIHEPILSERARKLNFTNEGGVGNVPSNYELRITNYELNHQDTTPAGITNYELRITNKGPELAKDQSIRNPQSAIRNRIRFLKNVGGLWLLQECQHKWERAGRAYTWPALVALAEQAKPLQSLVDPDAPEFLNPTDMETAIQAYCRRTGQPQPSSVGEVVRCCLESLALKYRWVLASLEDLLDRKLYTIRIVGGGSLNEMLCRMTANACGRQVVAGPVEATALGNILVQAVATGHLADIDSGRRAIAASVQQTTFEPDPSGDWDAAYARFAQLVRHPGA
jgi:rhamnulokinase